MHHIIWTNRTDGTFHDMLVGKETKEIIEWLEFRNLAQILSVKEDVK